MGIFIAYMIKSGFCLLLFYLLYKWQLAKETFFRLNRIMLLGFWILAFLLPAIPLVNWGNTDLPAGLDVNRPEILNSLTNISLSAETNTDHQAFIWTWLICTGYIVGVVLIASKQLVSWTRLYLLIRRGRRIENGPFHLILTEGNQSPFSWMHYIVLSEKDYRENPTEILTHEMAHIRHHHSWDLLLADVGILLQWFNPAAWLLKQEMQSVHEYEADDAVLAAGVNAKSYQLLLIKKAVGTSRYTMANSFNHSSLKKRITMMIKRKSNPWARMKCVYVLPLAAVAVAAFARPEVSDPLGEISNAKVTDLSAFVKADEVKSVENGPAAQPKDSLKGRMLILKSKKGSLKDNEVVVVGYASADESKAEKIFDEVDMVPEYPGGMKECFRFLAMNLRYPVKAIENHIEGNVAVRFVVEKDGSLSGMHVLQGADPYLDAEALRVIGSMPKWNPGRVDGKPVRTRFVLPIVFKLQEQEGKAKVDTQSAKTDGKPAESASKALVLVDGKEYVGDLSKINPGRIESITVLKDEEAAAVYGAKGKNGVVLVKTKKAGKLNAPESRIEYNVQDKNAVVRITASEKE